MSTGAAIGSGGIGGDGGTCPSAAFGAGGHYGRRIVYGVWAWSLEMEKEGGIGQVGKNGLIILHNNHSGLVGLIIWRALVWPSTLEEDRVYIQARCSTKVPEDEVPSSAVSWCDLAQMQLFVE